MKILILEDDLHRVAYFRRKFRGDDVTIVDTAPACVRQLQLNTFNLLCLDHDLGGQQYVLDPDGIGNTGYAVAKWLEANPDRQPVTIIIHSLNPVGAELMQQALPDAVRVPFFWTDKS